MPFSLFSLECPEFPLSLTAPLICFLFPVLSSPTGNVLGPEQLLFETCPVFVASWPPALGPLETSLLPFSCCIGMAHFLAGSLVSRLALAYGPGKKY